MEPLVSVIIPVYNVLPYLREALDSVINQTYKNLEILIVDDGSTDGSGEVCDEYLSDPRVIVIHQENKGLSGARNTALDWMTGEYVAFLDSDDAFRSEMVEQMVKAIARNNADIAICGYTTCYTNKAMNKTSGRKITNISFDEEIVVSSADALNLLIVEKICWSVWNKLYKRSVWENIRFPEGYNYEDVQVMCHLFGKCTQLVNVPKVYVYYRKRTGSITHSQSVKNIQDHLLAFLSVENYIKRQTLTIFLPNNVRSFQEHYARMLSNLYAQMLIHRHSIEEISKLRKETLMHWVQLNGVSCQFHSRITRFLFLHAPVLLLPARFCWQAGKYLLGREHP